MFNAKDSTAMQCYCRLLPVPQCVAAAASLAAVVVLHGILQLESMIGGEINGDVDGFL